MKQLFTVPQPTMVELASYFYILIYPLHILFTQHECKINFMNRFFNKLGGIEVYIYINP